MPISTTQGSAPATGAILAGYFRDRERLANLREQMQADLQPMPNIATDSTWKPLRRRSGFQVESVAMLGIGCRSACICSRRLARRSRSRK
ncbi:hypothetical protein [Pseudomonas aeruginosa]|uniref:hypothetical protein n=1 Tax=Pseudomonas aeruginosa TaxID=287 RepID=UPI0039B3F523